MKNLSTLIIILLLHESVDCNVSSVLIQGAASARSDERTEISLDSISEAGVISKSAENDIGRQQPPVRERFCDSLMIDKTGTDSVMSGIDGKTIKNARFGRRIKIFSDPFGAKIFKKDSLLGSTPFLFDDPGEEVKIDIKLDRFYDSTIVLGAGMAPSRIFLRPLNLNKEKGESNFLDPADKDELLPIYIAGGSAIISGAVAALYKIKADRLYSEYKTRIDDNKLEAIKRFDNISAISLIVSEVSVALLSYLLLNR